MTICAKDDAYQAIRTFLQNVKEGRNDLEKTVDFIYSLIHSTRQEAAPPLLEIVTILRHEKPILHRMLTLRFKDFDRRLKMLFDLPMDYGQAKERLLYDCHEKDE